MINFFIENITLKIPKPRLLKTWLKGTVISTGKNIRTLNYIFCSDEYLLGINQQYLNHDYFTDVITFDHSEDEQIEGDIFISVERITENAQTLSVTFEEELRRVMAHGLLHLLGLDDHTDDARSFMRKKENELLQLYPPSPNVSTWNFKL